MIFVNRIAAAGMLVSLTLLADRARTDDVIPTTTGDVELLVRSPKGQPLADSLLELFPDEAYLDSATSWMNDT